MIRGSVWRQWWETVSELDLEAIRAEAMRPAQLALIGRSSVTCDFLATLFTTDPRTGRKAEGNALLVYHPPIRRQEQMKLAQATALLVLGDAELVKGDLLEVLRNAARPTLVLISQASFANVEPLLGIGASGAGIPLRVLRVSIGDSSAIREQVPQAVLEMAPDESLVLARNLPLLRPTASNELIQRVARDNAIYAFSTALAELIPLLNAPMTVADLFVLTKNQALMAYRLALMMGEGGTWEEVLPGLIPVVGGGFLWRQVARSMVSLIPGWGLIPKVAIAYAGTRVTGQTIYHWYQHGERLTPPAVRALYHSAFQQGRVLAEDLYRQLRTGRRN